MSRNITHILIGCSGRMLDRPAAACELYTGPVFRAARTYAEASGVPWALLSAHYGLVMPAQVIEPQSTRLRAGAGRWPGNSEICRSDLGLEIARWISSRPALVAVHAGRAYARWTHTALKLALVHQIEVVAPLHGLQVGARLSWYRQRRAP